MKKLFLYILLIVPMLGSAQVTTIDQYKQKIEDSINSREVARSLKKSNIVDGFNDLADVVKLNDDSLYLLIEGFNLTGLRDSTNDLYDSVDALRATTDTLPTKNFLLNNYFKQGGNAFGAAQVFGTTDANYVSLITSNTERVRIHSNGNVGIGTNVDIGYKLDVNGVARFAGTNFYIGYEDVISVSRKSNGFYVYRFANNGDLSGRFDIYNASNTVSIRWSGNASASYFNTGGFLGIGVSAPASQLDINAAQGYSQLRLRTPYTPTSTADANGNVGDIAWDDNYIYIKTNVGWKRMLLSTY